MSNLNHTDIANKLLGGRSGGMRVAVKFGSACIVDPQTLERQSQLRSNVDDISKYILAKQNEACIISSGAVALGKKEFNMVANKKLSIAEKQACAAVGQIILSDIWTQHFSAHDKKVGQILLKRGDLDPESGNGSYQNFVNTNGMLLANGAIPVVNENDTTATEELRFGDNDQLGALVAKATECDVLVILSKEQGFYDRDPEEDGAKLYSVVSGLTDEHWQCATEATDDVSTGGMLTKLKAVDIALHAGIPVILGSGRSENSLEKIITGEHSCTCFVPPALLKQIT